jgi:3,4-dihydroxy-2-butanone 4-phosphate synthase
MSNNPISEVAESIRRGGFAILADHENRENEGDIILAITGDRAAELELEPMARRNTDPLGTAFTVSIDATHEHDVTTGISASDRASTARLAVTGSAADFSRPGHLFPLVARPGGVRERPGHTEAAIEITRLAGLRPAAVIVEIIGDDGRCCGGGISGPSPRSTASRSPRSTS